MKFNRVNSHQHEKGIRSIRAECKMCRKRMTDPWVSEVFALARKNVSYYEGE